MIQERMLELILLNQLNNYLEGLSISEYDEFCEEYDINKLRQRSEIITDEFLSPYVKNKSVTT